MPSRRLGGILSHKALPLVKGCIRSPDADDIHVSAVRFRDESLSIVAALTIPALAARAWRDRLLGPLSLDRTDVVAALAHAGLARNPSSRTGRSLGPTRGDVGLCGCS